MVNSNLNQKEAFSTRVRISIKFMTQIALGKLYYKSI